MDKSEIEAIRGLHCQVHCGRSRCKPMLTLLANLQSDMQPLWSHPGSYCRWSSATSFLGMVRCGANWSSARWDVATTWKLIIFHAICIVCAICFTRCQSPPKSVPHRPGGPGTGFETSSRAVPGCAGLCLLFFGLSKALLAWKENRVWISVWLLKPPMDSSWLKVAYDLV